MQFETTKHSIVVHVNEQNNSFFLFVFSLSGNANANFSWWLQVD